MIRHALKQAAKSEFQKTRHGAIVSRGRRILSRGTNSNRYTSIPIDRKFDNSVHAEQSAIGDLLSHRRHEDLVGATIYVARIGKAGEQRMSKPCPMCEDLIRTVGIKKVIYTTMDGTVEWNL